MRTTNLRSLSITLMLALLLLASSGCKRRRSSGQDAPLLASTIYAGDPNVAIHFAKGFFNVEENAWRWTGKEFAVDLSPPLHADQKGAQLVLQMVVPDAVIKKLNSVELSASIQGFKLEPQIFTKPGQYTYKRDIPADKLQGDVARIEFAVDHTLPPTENDKRQLGIIVSEVGLVAK
jgi:hypothetical protein